MILTTFKKIESPASVAQLVKRWSTEVTRSGDMPGLQACSPVGAVQEADDVSL